MKERIKLHFFFYFPQSIKVKDYYLKVLIIYILFSSI